jgi:farnesyl-diphosphate farnesyltransferase
LIQHLETDRMTSAGSTFCYGMLPKVSRTFALCIRLLPAGVEYPVLIAYLLCRVADTIEDTADISAEEKERLLARFRSCLEEGGPDATPLRDTFARQRTEEERLAAETDTVLREFRGLTREQRASIRPWVQEMSTGMAEFAKLNHGTHPLQLMSLATVEDLDRYCYYVAGTVGHLLTDLFRAVRPRVSPRHNRLKKLATSFGLGLQLTNIIKDVADDRKRGWSFVPRELCQLAGIRPEDLQDPNLRSESRQVMNALITKAQRHLVDALEYCTALPRGEYRIRLFCLTSLYFAVRTLRLAARDPRLLDPHHKVKITKGAVYRTVGVTVVCAPLNSLVRAYFRYLGGHSPLAVEAAAPA